MLKLDELDQLRLGMLKLDELFEVSFWNIEAGWMSWMSFGIWNFNNPKLSINATLKSIPNSGILVGMSLSYLGSSKALSLQSFEEEEACVVRILCGIDLTLAKLERESLATKIKVPPRSTCCLKASFRRQMTPKRSVSSRLLRVLCSHTS